MTSIAVSNLAWVPTQDEPLAARLRAAGVSGVEIAPTKVWPEPLGVDTAVLRAYRERWQEWGFRIPALQALLFGKLDLQLFAGEASRAAMAAHLRGMFRVAEALGARVLVFGSPKQRQRGDLDTATAMAIATEFFAGLAPAAADHGCVLCIEPNPVDYGCDFITTAAEGLALVMAVDHPGFGLHLDAAGMTLSGDDPAILAEALPWLCHFHASEPRLAVLGSGGVDHPAFASALHGHGYGHWVSVEMLAPEDDTALDPALALATRIYG